MVQNTRLETRGSHVRLLLILALSQSFTPTYTLSVFTGKQVKSRLSAEITFLVDTTVYRGSEKLK